MFKKASDRQSYQQRVASHATKPSPTGRVDDIPSDAKQPEEYYRSLADQFRALLDRYQAAGEEIAELNLRLRATLPFREFQLLKAERDRLGEIHQATQMKLAEYRPLLRAAEDNAWGTTFYECAERLLDRALFIKIDEATREFLQRDRREFGSGSKRSRDLTEEERVEFNKKESHQRRLRRGRRNAEVQQAAEVRLEQTASGEFRRVAVPSSTFVVKKGGSA